MTFFVYSCSNKPRCVEYCGSAYKPWAIIWLEGAIWTNSVISNAEMPNILAKQNLQYGFWSGSGLSIMSLPSNCLMHSIHLTHVLWKITSETTIACSGYTFWQHVGQLLSLNARSIFSFSNRSFSFCLSMSLGVEEVQLLSYVEKDYYINWYLEKRHGANNK